MLDYGVLMCLISSDFRSIENQYQCRSFNVAGSLSPATVNYTLTGTPIGRQLINPIQVINSTSFQVTRQMNDMKLRCQADVRDTNSTGNATFDSKVVEKTLIVYCK